MPGSTRFAIAIHLLCVLGCLEREGVDLVPSSQIALSANTHAVIIRNLIRALKNAGLVEAKEGKGGGVKLARSASKITLYEIYQAVEEGGVLTECDKAPFEKCPVSRGMKKVFSSLANDVDSAVAKTLRGKNLEDLIDRIPL